MALARLRVAARMIVPLLLAASSAAADTEQVPLGARAIGMGGAFCAVADDASAIFWNPAGLSRIGEEQLAFTHADLFGSGIHDDQASFVLPLSPARSQVLAGAWYHSGFDDGELTFGENRFDLSYALRPQSRVSVGSTVKLLTRGTELDQSTVGAGRGVGLDFGLQLNARDDLTIAVAAQDAFDTRLEYTSGDVAPGSSVAYPRHLRGGIAYAARRIGTVAFDVDSRLHLGLEMYPRKELALRTGLREDPSAHDLTYAFGAGFRTGTLRLDYAYEVHPVLGATHHLGLNMGFHLNPARIRIRSVRPEELYASLYKAYDRQPIGTVEIENRHDKPLAMKLGVIIPELMRTPVEYDTTLRPQAVTALPLRAVLARSVIENAGDRPIHFQVQGSYENGRTTRRDRITTKTVMYGAGAINWARGTDQAAAFVTTHDPVVDSLVARATREGDLDGVEFPSTNLRNAASIVDVLAVAGITYAPDPDNPYSRISEKPHSVDTIRYPRETLRRLSGDCDDTSVLAAALLENAGMRTRLVDAPGHLFLLFDSGVHARNRLALNYPDRLLVVDEDRVWIPLETTHMRDGFAAAWASGADGWASWKGVLSTTDVAVAQERYPESDPPGTAPAPLAWDARALRLRLRSDSDTLLSWRVGSESPRVAATTSGWVDVARVYLEAGDLAAARSTLERARQSEPASAALQNDLAVVSVAEGDLRGARQLLEAMTATGLAGPGEWLNLGFVRHLAGDATAGNRALAEGLKRCGGLAAAGRLLGIEIGEGGAGGSELERLRSAMPRGAGSGSPATFLYWRR